MAKMVIIEHQDGRRYAIQSADYRRKRGMERTYEEQGFAVAGYEDGEPYEPPKRGKAAGDETPSGEQG